LAYRAATIEDQAKEMPIDINSLRTDRGGDPDAVRDAQRKRFKEDPDGLVDAVLTLDKRWRELVTDVRHLKTKLNKLQIDVIAPKKRQKQPCDAEVAEAQQLRDEIVRVEKEHADCEFERDQQICKLGNIVDPAVPVSETEDDNEVVCEWTSPQLHPGAQGELLTHDDLLWRIGGYDPERGSKVAGGRGYFLQDAGVLLNQALINYATTFLRNRKYSPIQVPFFMKKDLMAGIAQLGDFDEQLYKVSTGKMGTAEDPADKYLIATSEQPLCAFHAKEVLEDRELPLRYAGISTCFRKEVGKANVDNRGIFRVHQFEKVEQFCITTGDLEESKKMHQEMLQTAKDFHEALGIGYRVINIVSGELNDAAMIKYDLEGWFPGQGQYRELVSCSNCTDFQSRAMDIRYRFHKVEDEKSSVHLAYVHMLNSTLTATGRGICCILETYQTPEGVRVPEALVPFMGGTTFIPFVRGPRDVSAGGAATKGTAKPSKPTATHKPTAAPCAAAPIAAKPSKTAEKPPAVPTPKLSKPVLAEGAVKLDALEAKLLECPYVDGFTPSQLDVDMLAALQEAHTDLGKHPNVVRWMQHIASFTPLQRRAWG